MIALGVANATFEERGDSTGLRETTDTLGAPKEENKDLTNYSAELHLFLFRNIIEYSIDTNVNKFVLNKYI